MANDPIKTGPNAQLDAGDAALYYISEELHTVKRELAEARAEIAAVSQVLFQSGGPRAGLLLIDRATELVVQRNADEERVTAWQNELRQAQLEIGVLTARLEECRKRPKSWPGHLRHELTRTGGHCQDSGRRWIGEAMTDDPRAAAFEKLLTDEVLIAALQAWHLDYSESRKAMRAVLVAALLKAAPPAEGPTWQPTDPSRAKPEPFTTAVVLCGDGKVRVLTRTYRGEWMDDLKYGTHFVVTHWLDVPLPTPPRDPAEKESK